MANARPHRPLRRLSDEDRARAVGRLEAGIPPQTVADHLMSIAVLLYDFVKRHRVAGRVSDRPRSGRPKVTTHREDRYLAVTVARRRFVDGPSLVRMLQHQRGPGGRPISVQTVRNRVRAVVSDQGLLLGSHGLHHDTEP